MTLTIAVFHIEKLGNSRSSSIEMFPQSLKSRPFWNIIDFQAEKLVIVSLLSIDANSAPDTLSELWRRPESRYSRTRIPKGHEMAKAFCRFIRHPTPTCSIFTDEDM